MSLKDRVVVWGSFLRLGEGLVVEAVGMWKSRSDFQGRWEGWEAWVWLSMLSTDRHFHSLLGCLWIISSFLLPVHCAAESVRFRAGLKNVRSVRNPVQQGFAQSRVRDHLRPFRKR